jgi:hypothetical protein
MNIKKKTNILHVIYIEEYCKLHILCKKGEYKECPKENIKCYNLIKKSYLQEEPINIIKERIINIS